MATGKIFRFKHSFHAKSAKVFAKLAEKNAIKEYSIRNREA